MLVSHTSLASLFLPPVSPFTGLEQELWFKDRQEHVRSLPVHAIQMKASSLLLY